MGSSTFMPFRDMIEKKMNTPNHKKDFFKKVIFVLVSVTLFEIMIGIVKVYCQESNMVRMDRWHLCCTK